MQIASTFVDNQSLIGLQNGANRIFVTRDSPIPPACLRLFRNGVLQTQTLDYWAVANNVVHFNYSPRVADFLTCFYRYPSTYFYQGSQFADAEVPGVLNNNFFTLQLNQIPYPVESLEFYWNGILMVPGQDYSLSSNNLTLLTARGYNPDIDVLQTFYRFAGVCAGIPSFADNEIPGGVVDGNNATFTLANIPIGVITGFSLKIYINGVLVSSTKDYGFTNPTTILFNDAPPVGSVIRAFYRYTDITTVAARSQAFLKADIVPYLQRNLNDVSAKVWPVSTIEQIVNQGEVDIANDLNSTWIRFPLGIRATVGVYSLPANLKQITRITYRGFKLDMIDQNQLSILSPVYRDTRSTPRWASIQYDGYYGLRLFPVPSENLPILSDQNSIYLDTNLRNECVISGYLYPTECTKFFQLPDYLFRRTIRFFVLWKCFGMEGIGQILETSQYYKARFESQMMKNKKYMTQVYSSKEMMLSDVPKVGYGRKPHRPLLPENFGVIV